MNTNIYKQNKLLKFIIFLLVGVIGFTLTGCEGDDLDYSDFADDHLNSWAKALTQEEDQYLLYYYGVNCSHCKTIKQEILNFANENDASLKVYFIESGEVSYENYEMYPVNDPLTGEPIPGTPTVIVVTDGRARAMLVGPSPIKDLLLKINEGSYGFIK